MGLQQYLDGCKEGAVYLPKFFDDCDEVIFKNSSELIDITPKEFFGAQNKNIELLKRYFPKLKIVARGTKITAFGDEELLAEFDKRIKMLLSHFQKFKCDKRWVSWFYHCSKVSSVSWKQLSRVV